MISSRAGCGAAAEPCQARRSRRRQEGLLSRRAERKGGQGASIDPAKTPVRSEVGTGFSKLSEGGCNTSGRRLGDRDQGRQLRCRPRRRWTSPRRTTRRRAPPRRPRTRRPRRSGLQQPRISTSPAPDLSCRHAHGLPLPGGLITTIDCRRADSCCNTTCKSARRLHRPSSASRAQLHLAGDAGRLRGRHRRTATARCGRQPDLRRGRWRPGLRQPNVVTRATHLQPGRTAVASPWAGASNNTLGNIDTTIGNGVTTRGRQVVLAGPVNSRTWSPPDATCPTAGLAVDSGTDTPGSRGVNFILCPTRRRQRLLRRPERDLCSRGAVTRTNNAGVQQRPSKPCGSAPTASSPEPAVRPRSRPTTSGLHGTAERSLLHGRSARQWCPGIASRRQPALRPDLPTHAATITGCPPRCRRTAPQPKLLRLLIAGIA